MYAGFDLAEKNSYVGATIYSGNINILFLALQVAHEVLALEILTLLLENPTDDSAEVAITFLKEVITS